MLTIVCFGNLCVNKVSFLQQLNLKNKNKTLVQLYRLGINGLNIIYICIRYSYSMLNI